MKVKAIIENAVGITVVLGLLLVFALLSAFNITSTATMAIDNDKNSTTSVAGTPRCDCA